jgi:hypothetical protein
MFDEATNPALRLWRRFAKARFLRESEVELKLAVPFFYWSVGKCSRKRVQLRNIETKKRDDDDS